MSPHNISPSAWGFQRTSYKMDLAFGARGLWKLSGGRGLQWCQDQEERCCAGNRSWGATSARSQQPIYKPSQVAPVCSSEMLPPVALGCYLLEPNLNQPHWKRTTLPVAIDWKWMVVEIFNQSALFFEGICFSSWRLNDLNPHTTVKFLTTSQNGFKSKRVLLNINLTFPFLGMWQKRKLYTLRDHVFSLLFPSAAPITCYLKRESLSFLFKLF